MTDAAGLALDATAPDNRRHARHFVGHAGQGFWPVLNGGAPAVIFCFLWLYISAAGGGPWSLDAAIPRRR